MISNPEIAKVTWNLLQDDHENFVVSTNVSLYHNISKVIAVYNFTVPNDKNDNEYKKLIMKRNADVCRMAKGNISNKIGNMMIDEIEKHANFEVKCPFTKVKNLIY